MCIYIIYIYINWFKNHVWRCLRWERAVLISQKGRRVCTWRRSVEWRVCNVAGAAVQRPMKGSVFVDGSNVAVWTHGRAQISPMMTVLTREGRPQTCRGQSIRNEHVVRMMSTLQIDILRAGSWGKCEGGHADTWHTQSEAFQSEGEYYRLSSSCMI